MMIHYDDDVGKYKIFIIYLVLNTINEPMFKYEACKIYEWFE